MSSPISETEVKQAQAPHNLFISGLFVFDLLLTPAIIGLKIGMLGMLIPVLCSGGLIAYIYLRGTKTSSSFVAAHWKLAYRRGLLLFAGYGISAVLIFIAWLFSLSIQQASMGHIIWTALTLIAIVPTLAMVMVTMVMEISAATAALKRQIPGVSAPAV